MISSRIAWRFVLVLLVAAIVLSVISATPSGPDSINIIGSSRFNVTGAQTVPAQAGNITEFNANANGITQTWQGYFGNVSGAILLADANNHTFYDWNSASPYGEIYAVRNSTVPAWASIQCASTAQINAEDLALNVTQATDADSVNRTFLNSTSFTQFYVGNKNINTTQNCFAVNLFNSSGQSTTNFGEVLLHDGSNLVYTGLLAPKTTGFDNKPHDFEMLVGANGHNGASGIATYYFYLELG